MDDRYELKKGELTDVQANLWNCWRVQTLASSIMVTDSHVSLLVRIARFMNSREHPSSSPEKAS